MTSITACALAPELTVREIDPVSLASMHAELEDAVRSLCPHFESTGEGVIYAAFHGLERRYIDEGEGGFLDDLRSLSERLGLPTRVGLASTRFAARAAAVMEGRIPGRGIAAVCVDPGDEARFLARLPIELLPAATDVIDAMRKLGIHTLGRFAELPRPGIARRWGERGSALQRLAGGEDRGTLIPVIEPQAFTVRILSDYPIEKSEALLFLLRRPTERLTAELDAAGSACRALKWTLELEGIDPQHGVTRSAGPSASSKLWRDLLKVTFERMTLASGVLAVRLEAAEIGVQTIDQVRLMGPRAAPPGALATTLAHLAAEVGPEGFGVLRPDPAVRPEARFRASPGDGPFPAPRLPKRDRVDSWVPDRAPIGVLPTGLRCVIPPVLVEPDLRGGRLVGFRFEGGFMRADRVLGPWDISSEWWEPNPVRRRCFQVEGAGSEGEGSVAHVFLQPDTGSWFLTAWLD
jgi:protein ImuB